MKHAILIIAYHQADFIKQCIDNFDDDFLVFIHWDKRAELTEADRLMLAELLSPLFGPLNEPERAVAIFEDLARQNHPKAMRRLAKHHTVGCGVPINKNRAESLLSAARYLDGEEPETVEVSSRWAGFFIGFSVAAVALSVGIGVYTAISKRK